jgi:26S proteasome non-ATPase regulatory subunit 9
MASSPGASAVASARAARARVAALGAARGELEAALAEALPRARAGEPLVDGEGFPRADLDVYAVRTARGQCARLQNDLRAAGAELDAALAALHACGPEAVAAALAAAREEAAAAREEAAAAAAAAEGAATLREPAMAVAAAPVAAASAAASAFAAVDAVAPDSPASAAGLRRGDRLVRVGGACSLATVAAEVRAHEGREMSVAVLRARGDGENEELALTLVPRAWPGGQGLLGCHIVPLSQ